MTKRQNHHSKSLFYDDGVLRHADVVSEIFELHRKSHHYSLEKQKPGSKEAIARKVNHIPREFIEEALEVYRESGKKLGQKPHPNYFVAVARRLYLDKSREYSYTTGSNFTNLGRSI